MKEQDGIRLINKVIADENLWEAYEKVKANKGAPGMDGITVHQLKAHMVKHHQPLRRKLKDGTYQPQPVKRVAIPKPDGSKRYLGIPCVLDRVVQQAILQVIDPLIDPQFSERSFGFRKGRNAHQAVKLAEQYYQEGYRVAVDCDLKSYFDTIHHQRVRAYLEEFITDKTVLKLIWKFLRSVILDKDIYIETTKGAPQGGPLSPILANVYLNKLDRELETRGHRFIRYADDFVIYVKSKRAGERVMESITKFIEKDLGLVINRKKSKICGATKSTFLGFNIHNHMGKIGCRPSGSSKQRFKDKLRKQTSRKRRGEFKEIIKKINQITTGWMNYYGISRMRTFIGEIQEWFNHRMRQLIWKRWKKPKTKYRMLRKYGIGHDDAMKSAHSRKGYWRISRSETLHRAITKGKLIKWGLKDMSQLYELRYLKG
jgi:group II intron reverse transcriptase/maturase